MCLLYTQSYKILHPVCFIQVGHVCTSMLKKLLNNQQDCSNTTILKIRTLLIILNKLKNRNSFNMTQLHQLQITLDYIHI